MMMMESALIPGKDRMQIKAQIERRLKQLTLPYVCHALVISEPGSDTLEAGSDDACNRLGWLRVPRKRFQGSAADWYHVSTFSSVTFEHTAVWGFVSHEALHFFNEASRVTVDSRSATPLQGIETQSDETQCDAADAGVAGESQSNKSSGTWEIPRHLCVREAAIMTDDPQVERLLLASGNATLPPMITALQFSYYQFDSAFERAFATLTERELEAAFRVRLQLYAWLQRQGDLDAQHQLQPEGGSAVSRSTFDCKTDSSPQLSREMSEMVDVTDACNLTDEALYFLCASQVRFVPEATGYWLQGETDLLRLKLMRYPQLSKQLCRLLGGSTDLPLGEPGPASLAEAYLRTKELHRSNVCTVQQHSMVTQKKIPIALRQLARRFLKLLFRRAVSQVEDYFAKLAVLPLLNPRAAQSQGASKGAANRSRRIEVSDLLDYAPACMQSLLQKSVVGTDAEKVQTSSHERAVISAFMFEQGFSKREITLLSRPHCVIGYEDEQPQQSLEWIERTIALAEPRYVSSESQRKDRGVPSTASVGKQTQLQPLGDFELTCSYLMKHGFCCHKKSLDRSRSHSNSSVVLTQSFMELEAKKREVFIQSKRRCHQQLMQTKSRGDGASKTSESTRRGRTEWTSSPSSYTALAFKGRSRDAAATPNICNTASYRTESRYVYRVDKNKAASASESGRKRKENEVTAAAADDVQQRKKQYHTAHAE